MLRVPGRQTEPSDGTQQDGCRRRAKPSHKPGTFRRLGNEGQLVAHGQQWPECASRALSVSGVKRETSVWSSAVTNHQAGDVAQLGQSLSRVLGALSSSPINT